MFLTAYLSAKCPVAIAPAMDLDMYAHPSTQSNLSILKERGVEIIEPAEGELASGLIGKGRMEDPIKLVGAVKAIFAKSGSLNGKTVVITAGPTQEAIDPVRYITNHSSGKMGYSIAEEFAERGARVELISGPVNISTNNPLINITKVVSANDMFEQTKKFVNFSDIFVSRAAKTEARRVG